MDTRPSDPLSLPGSKDWLFSRPLPGAFRVFDRQDPLARPCRFCPLPDTPAPVLRALGALIQDLARVSGDPIPPDPRVFLEGYESHDGAPVVWVGMADSPHWPLDPEHRKDLEHRVRGRWESAVGCPVPRESGPTYALMGSDPRGLVYALYRWSEAAGISPWHWWSATAAHPPRGLWVRGEAWVLPEPAVRYRGIFLNDEYPALSRWVEHVWGQASPRDEPPVPPGVANYGAEFYGQVFDLILRLGGNCLWPAMWNNALAEDDPGTLALARDCGIVLGTSHQEPMGRAQKEWDRRYGETLGHWDWQAHQAELEAFWEEGAQRSRSHEAILTLGLRGANDTELALSQGASHSAALEAMVARQREIITRVYGVPVETVPQVWCLYKEVLDLYHQGLRVPDDVTILWSDDNWGNLRRLPTEAERQRPGGSGMYYHLDYHGGPRSYQWINTSPLEKIQDQMSLAYDQGVRRLWIVNVGHLKGYEVSLEYFIRLGWDPPMHHGQDASAFYRAWAGRELGPAHGPAAGDLLQNLLFQNGLVKPELLSPSTFTPGPGEEWDRACATWEALEGQSQGLAATLPPEDREAWYQYLGHPIKASSILYRLYRAAARNLFCARGGWAGAARWEARCRDLFAADQDHKDHYNRRFAQGRWCHFADQTHLGYLNWADPPQDSLRALDFLPEAEGAGLASWGLSGLDAGPEGQGLVHFRGPWEACRRLGILARAGNPNGAIRLRIDTDLPWVRVEPSQVLLGDEAIITLRVDWDRVPEGESQGTLVIRGAGEALVPLEIHRPLPPPPAFDGFVEGPRGVVMDAPHCQAHGATAQARWEHRAPYGRWSGALVSRSLGAAPLPLTAPAWVEYRFWLSAPRTGNLALICGPGLNVHADLGMGVLAAMDDEEPRWVESLAPGFVAQHHNAQWEALVAAGQETLPLGRRALGAGAHRLRLEASLPNFILLRVLFLWEDRAPSFFGEVESPRTKNTKGPFLCA